MDFRKEDTVKSNTKISNCYMVRSDKIWWQFWKRKKKLIEGKDFVVKDGTITLTFVPNDWYTIHYDWGRI